ncbi:MAG TPA: hypothetical protein O0X98_01760 [Methanocorpusculum sp.]|nr:hypothetical protein [Methanocorpusculum sp.]
MICSRFTETLCGARADIFTDASSRLRTNIGPLADSMKISATSLAATESSTRQTGGTSRIFSAERTADITRFR